MSTDKEIAQKIENEAMPEKGGLSTNVIDEILTSNAVLNDKSLASAIQNQLQDAGILPQLAIDTFSDPTVFKAFLGENGQISQGKLEQARETGKVDGNDVSATSRFLADALLKRWQDIDTDGRPGISLEELKNWGSSQGARGQDSGDYRILPFPASDAPISPITRAGIVNDITDGIGDKDYRTPSPEGWRRWTSEKNGVSVFVDQDKEFVAKIGPADKIVAQAEALKVLHDQLGMPVPNFQLYTDVDKNGKPVAVLVMDKVEFDTNQMLTVAVINPHNPDRELSRELERQSEALIERANQVLKAHGFSTDFGNGENWGTQPGAIEKIRDGKPLTMGDLMVIDPVTDRNPIKPEQSFDDFMKNVSPFLKNFTDCHKLWQLINGTLEMPPLNLGGPAKMRGFPLNEGQGETDSTILPVPSTWPPRVRFKGRNDEQQTEPVSTILPEPTQWPPKWRFKGRNDTQQTEPETTILPVVKDGVPPRVRFRRNPDALQTDPEATILPVKTDGPPRVRIRRNLDNTQTEPEATILPETGGEKFVPVRFRRRADLPKTDPPEATTLPDSGKVIKPKLPEGAEVKPPVNEANKGKPPARDAAHQGKPPFAEGSNQGEPPARNIVDRGQPPAKNMLEKGQPPARNVVDRGQPPPRGPENQNKPEWDPVRHEWKSGHLRPPPPRNIEAARDAAWDRLVDRWNDLSQWKKLHLSEDELRRQVNEGIHNAQTARRYGDEQMWRDFKKDLIEVGLLRPEEPMKKVKVKTIDPPMMRLF